ncbi:MAG: LysR family transcriptional regulator [Rubrivivax sp.]
MSDLNDLRFFAHVVDRGSFVAAARSLGVPKSRLSRRIAALEARLGVRLLHRTTRKLALTDAGRDVHVHVRAMLAAAEAAERAAADRSGVPRGLLRVSCPTGLAQYDLHRVMARFLLEYPEVRIEMLVTNRRIDLIEEGVDVALRVRTAGQEDTNLAMRHLRDSAPIVVAAPALLKKVGPLAEPADLARVPAVEFSTAPGPVSWLLIGPAGEERRVEVSPRLRADDFAITMQAAIEGVGVAVLPDYIVEPEIERGTLVRVLPQWRQPAGKAHLAYASGRLQAPAVRAFIEFVVAHFERCDNGAHRNARTP